MATQPAQPAESFNGQSKWCHLSPSKGPIDFSQQVPVKNEKTNFAEFQSKMLDGW